VVWTEGKRTNASSAYLILTDEGGLDSWRHLVIRHAPAVLEEVKRHGGNVDTIVFAIRNSVLLRDTFSRHAAITGFSIAQMREIAAASPDVAERLVQQHAWSFGEYPK